MAELKKDKYKTKAKLIKEMESFRKEIVKLKKAETKLKQAGKELFRKKEEKIDFFAKILKTSPVSVITTDQDSKITYVNPATEKLFGYSAAELIGKSPDILNAELNADEVQKKIIDTVSQGKVWKGELLQKNKNGELFYIQTSVYQLLDREGNFIALVGFQEDITERKGMGEALRESEERYRNLVENINLGITLIGSDYRIIWTNAAQGRLFKKPANEFIGKECFQEFEKYNRVCPHCPGTRAMATARPAEVETEGIRDDGSSFVVHIYAFPNVDSGGNVIGFIEVVEDITERKHVEEKLLIYQEQLRSLASELSLTEERERRRIASDLHDRIGQSLAISKIELGMLQKELSYSELAKSVKKIYELISQTIQDTRSLIFELSPPILYELGFEAAVEWLSEQIKEQHNIMMEFEDDNKPKPLDDNIRVLLFQAVRELLVNIAKHSQARNAKVSLKNEGSNIQIKIEDDGVGFDISRRYAQDNNSRGFGLFSIIERLDYFGGRFKIVSKPGHGTKVTLFAPLKRKGESIKGDSYEHKDSLG